MELSVMYSLLGLIGILALFFVLTQMLGFTAQRPTDYANDGVEFDIRERLNGKMICEGVIYGPLGRVVTRFVAEMNAKWDGNKGYMTETFSYDSGGGLDREWNLELDDSGQIRATAPDIVGQADGLQMGSGVKLNYRIKLPESGGGHVLNTTDWMYLLENGTIVNRSQMRKFGIKVAELVAVIRKP